MPVTFGIVTLGIYKLFELFVCKKERLTIIEKMGERFTPDMLEHKISFSSIGNISFSALKIGSLLVGMGLGLLIGFFLCINTIPGYTSQHLGRPHGIPELIYGASVLLFGGIGLLIAFVVELKLGRDKR